MHPGKQAMRGMGKGDFAEEPDRSAWTHPVSGATENIRHTVARQGGELSDNMKGVSFAMASGQDHDAIRLK